ncbi:tyrosine-type recombinase/integrase [Sphingopyxis sp.]|jgi:integrase|uniref:tyrosine-type recombinase/integrase n=1 Tax=Sphingopyxis sp. TaxID=1908224 RepID=UPI00311E3E75
MTVAKLDQTTVLATHCPKGQRYVRLYDTHVTGFCCEILPSGNKTYALRYKNEYGRQKQYKIGNAADITCDKARKLAIKARARVVEGKDPAEERAVTRRIPTLTELSERYLDYVRTYKRSHAIDERYLRIHVLPKFGKRHLNEIEQQEVLDWLDAKVKVDGYAQATVNRWQVILGYMCKLAKKWGLPGADRNPLEGVQQKPCDNVVERYLSIEETKRLLEAVDASPNTQLPAIVRMLMLTGCRKRELLDAKWSEIDLDRQSWRIPMERAKTSKSRQVALSEAAMEVLRSLRRWEGCDYVVPNPETLQPYTSIYHSWDSARRSVGLGDIRVHDLRHAFATRLAEAGTSIYIVSKALGHASVRSSERYAKISDQTLRDASNLAANMIGAEWVSQRAGAQ